MALSSHKRKSDHPSIDPVIGYANCAKFLPGQRIRNPSVESRMCLWCKDGCGTVAVNGTRFTMHPGDYLFLPWKHHVEYTADAHKPFWLAGIHVIPWHDPRRHVEYFIPHAADQPLTGCVWRSDRDLGPLTGLVHFHLPEDASLCLLSEYIVRLFLAENADESALRAAARLLILELTQTFLSISRAGDRRSNTEFHRVCDFITSHIQESLAVADLAKHLQCSASTINRLFRSHARMSPGDWIGGQRIQRARLLLATTRLSVGAIGQQVGVEDPFYFSKLFKKRCGESPLAYRKRTPLL